jgi:hypothetical protein
MLTALDIMTGKILVQLHLVSAEDVRAELRALDSTPEPDHDLVNRLSASGKLAEKDRELVRHRAALYEHVRAEASYLRLLERDAGMKKATVARLIAGLERHAFRRRLGEVLVKDGKLTKEQDKAFSQKTRQAMDALDTSIVDRYRRENFAGIEKPLIPDRKLEPDDFKISTLFRTKETRALVAMAEESAKKERAAPPPAPAAPTQKHEHVAVPLDEPAAPEPGPKKDDADARLESLKARKAIGDYQVIELLGAGGMGAVYLGQKAGAYEYVAIKVMLNDLVAPRERGRFEREITLTRRVKHKNVIDLLDSGSTPDGLTYLVVPALAGKELRAHLKLAPDGLEPDIACAIFEQILEGLEAVHQNHIIHRDLKPENIFVLAGGDDVKLMDFGLAKLDNEADKEAPGTFFRTVAGEVLGSPPYIAPESVASDPVDQRTDIYSLGVVFFEMLTGKRPIESQTIQGFLTAHLVGAPLTLAEAKSTRKWPPEAEALLARMLAKTKEERPANCRVILDEMRAGLSLKIVETANPLMPTTRISIKEVAPNDPARFGVNGLLGRLWG